MINLIISYCRNRLQQTTKASVFMRNISRIFKTISKLTVLTLYHIMAVQILSYGETWTVQKKGGREIQTEEIQFSG
jgi:hypothetical protein